MKTQSMSCIRYQRGVATLAVALLLLFLVTIVTLYTANTSVMEQKVSANQYRADQAFSAANAALDYGIARLDYDWPEEDTPLSSPPVSIEYAFSDPRDADWVIRFLDDDGNLMPPLIEGTGYSDDASAMRTMSVRLSTFDSKGEGVAVPLVSHNDIQVGGTFTVKNLFGDDNIWSGKGTGIKNDGSSSLDSRVRNRSTVSTPQAVHGIASENICDDDNYVTASTKAVGESGDIVDEDINLAKLSEDQFWTIFFTEDRNHTRENALANKHPDLPGGQFWDGINQNNTGDVPWTDLRGLAWVEGTPKIVGNTQIGTPDAPVILIVDGHLELGGGATIYGLLYVTGDLGFGGGGTTVNGAVIVEGNPTLPSATESDAYDSIGDSGYDQSVGLTGTNEICFRPDLLAKAEEVAPNIGVIPGTWKDW